MDELELESSVKYCVVRVKYAAPLTICSFHSAYLAMPSPSSCCKRVERSRITLYRVKTNACSVKSWGMRHQDSNENCRHGSLTPQPYVAVFDQIPPGSNPCRVQRIGYHGRAEFAEHQGVTKSHGLPHIGMMARSTHYYEVE
jgi:hypothetical protein